MSKPDPMFVVFFHNESKALDLRTARTYRVAKEIADEMGGIVMIEYTPSSADHVRSAVNGEEK